MTVLAILGYVAAIVVAVITIWNTATVSRMRLRVRGAGALYARRERKRQTENTRRFAAEPAMVEIEERFDELRKAFESRDVPFDLRVLWAKVFRLIGRAPVKPPFQYGELVIHWDMNAMTIQKGDASITGWAELDPLRIPPPPYSAMAPTLPAIPMIQGDEEPKPRWRVGSRRA